MSTRKKQGRGRGEGEGEGGEGWEGKTVGFVGKL